MPHQVVGLYVYVCVYVYLVVVVGALHCSSAGRAKGRDSLCVVVVMRLSAQL